MMRRAITAVGLAALLGGAIAMAAAPDGAIFTTLPDGSRVNFNIYDAKPHVYLDGGPGDQAPQSAAGLPDGTYVFQVTDPSGKVLLSVDRAACREFTVAAGVITAAVPAGGCEHATGVDQDHGAQGAVTIQLCGGGNPPGTADAPLDCFLDTPNPGGEYKVWVTQEADYLNGCAVLGVGNGLDVVDCGAKKQGNAHGFVPRHSKTDNFKVGGYAREIDTRFIGTDGNYIDGMLATWTDPLGASNNKWSYLDLEHEVHHEAHVEDVENGTHIITIANQPGCTVGYVVVDGRLQRQTGPQSVSISVTNKFTFGTIWVDVYCK